MNEALASAGSTQQGTAMSIEMISLILVFVGRRARHDAGSGRPATLTPAVASWRGRPARRPRPLHPQLSKISPVGCCSSRISSRKYPSRTTRRARCSGPLPSSGCTSGGSSPADSPHRRSIFDSQFPALAQIVAEAAPAPRGGARRADPHPHAAAGREPVRRAPRRGPTTAQPGEEPDERGPGRGDAGRRGPPSPERFQGAREKLSVALHVLWTTGPSARPPNRVMGPLRMPRAWPDDSPLALHAHRRECGEHARAQGERRGAERGQAAPLHGAEIAARGRQAAHAPPGSALLPAPPHREPEGGRRRFPQEAQGVDPGDGRGWAPGRAPPASRPDPPEARRPDG